MGCQCNNQKEDLNDELTNKDENIEEVENYTNNEQKGEMLGLSNKKGDNAPKLKVNNNENQTQKDEEYNEKINEDKNTKYADYPEKMLELINKIREDPASYSYIIENSIHYIIEKHNIEDETKSKFIFKKKVKVSLTRGEQAFREAAEKLRNMEPLPPLEFNNDICVPLPDNEEEIKDNSYLKEQVKIIRETTNIDMFFQDLIKLPEVSALLMVVDDGKKNVGRKRNAILNKDFKYIGISSKFVGKTFIAYFTFSK